MGTGRLTAQVTAALLLVGSCGRFGYELSPQDGAFDGLRSSEDGQAAPGTDAPGANDGAAEIRATPSMVVDAAAWPADDAGGPDAILDALGVPEGDTAVDASDFDGAPGPMDAATEDAPTSPSADAAVEQPVDAALDLPAEEVDAAVTPVDAAEDVGAPADAEDATVSPVADAGEDAAALMDGALEAGGEADAPADVDSAAPACTPALVWETHFDEDPTQVDRNGDGIPDWTMRYGAPFIVSELQNGQWRPSTFHALDTRPTNPFSQRTIVEVRFQSIDHPSGDMGAVFWINLNQDQPLYVALFADLQLQPGGGQRLRVSTRNSSGQAIHALDLPDLPERLIDLRLDIDPVALTVAMWVDGASHGTQPIESWRPPNNDQFATLITWSGAENKSVFDWARVTLCQP